VNPVAGSVLQAGAGAHPAPGAVHGRYIVSPSESLMSDTFDLSEVYLKP
jgi:hypothetical protein